MSLSNNERVKLVKKYNINTKDPWRSKVVRTGITFSDCEVLGNNGRESAKRSWFVHCSKCAEDPDMFGDGVFNCGVKAIDNKTVCACNAKSFRYTEIQHKILVERKASRQGYKFLGWVDNKYSKSNTYLRFKCAEGHGWSTTSLTKFLVSDRGCPTCAGNLQIKVEDFIHEATAVHPNLDYTKTRSVRKNNGRPSFTVNCPKHGEFITDKQHHIIRRTGCPHLACVGKKISENKAHTTEQFINKAIKIHKDTYDYSSTEYHRSFSKVNIYCNACEKEFTQAASDHLSGNGCPSCAGNNQRQCYIFSIEDHSDVFVACKFGIAVDYKIRLSKQNRYSVYEVKVLQVYDMPTVESCKGAEREVSATVVTKYLSKEEYLDGYTETTSINSIQTIIDIYKNFGGILREENNE